MESAFRMQRRRDRNDTTAKRAVYANRYLPMICHIPTTILLAEDDPGHALLIEKNLRRAGINSKIITVTDGQTAVDILLKRDGFQDITLSGPLLVLLDLNLPVMDGYEVLKAVKQHTHAKRIPIIVLTTTDNPGEVAKCYDLGCNAYITKPVEYEAFCKAMQNLGYILSGIQVPDTI
jgi:CheY-like chemotaxis protein